MAITEEQAMENKDEYAITCCRFEDGTIIEPSHLEDPVLIPDLEDSGLLTIPDNALKIGEVLGGKMTKTLDALTALTPDVVEGITKMESEVEEIEEVEEKVEEVVEEAVAAQPMTAATSNQNIKIQIGEGKDINIEIPFPVAGQGVSQPDQAPAKELEAETGKKINEKIEDIELRSLTKKYFQIDKVEFGEETMIEANILYIRKDIIEDAINSQDLVADMDIDFITSDRYDEYANTIMDIQPIATKEEGKLGEGITRVLDGVVLMLNGVDEKGVQIGEFGSSEGIIEENIMWGRPGSPEKGEILIKIDVIIKEGKGMERPGPMAAHRSADFITQEIREVLKELDNNLVSKEEKFVQKRRPNKKKVVIVKEIMGQGAMHDNYLLPNEPVGIVGAKANVDLGNVPIFVSPLQVLDGCVHALTCIGPASKETSRHYFREPLILEAMEDEEIDLAGIIFIGSPQANSEKYYVSNILGMTIEAMDVDGAIVNTEGFGNNHVDFASHIEQIGGRGIPVVGMTFAAEQGQLVVGNPYMDGMIDLNKSAEGIENEILGNNCLCKEDAIRVLYMLKAKMAGEDIKVAERKYDNNVKLKNIKLIEDASDRKIDLVENETSLKNSSKNE